MHVAQYISLLPMILVSLVAGIVLGASVAIAIDMVETRAYRHMLYRQLKRARAQVRSVARKEAEVADMIKEMRENARRMEESRRGYDAARAAYEAMMGPQGAEAGREAMMGPQGAEAGRRSSARP